MASALAPTRFGGRVAPLCAVLGTTRGGRHLAPYQREQRVESVREPGSAGRCLLTGSRRLPDGRPVRDGPWLKLESGNGRAAAQVALGPLDNLRGP